MAPIEATRYSAATAGRALSTSPINVDVVESEPMKNKIIKLVKYPVIQ